MFPFGFFRRLVLLYNKSVMLPKKKIEGLVSDVKKIVREFAKILKENRIAFKRIYLFGSHAVGKAGADSDIDVAVVVSHLPMGKGYLDKKMRLWELAPKADGRIEPILLEECEVDDPHDLSIMGDEVRKHGILVVSS